MAVVRLEFSGPGSKQPCEIQVGEVGISYCSSRAFLERSAESTRPHRLVVELASEVLLETIESATGVQAMVRAPEEMQTLLARLIASTAATRKLIEQMTTPVVTLLQPSVGCPPPGSTVQISGPERAPAADRAGCPHCGFSAGHRAA